MMRPCLFIPEENGEEGKFWNWARVRLSVLQITCRGKYNIRKGKHAGEIQKERIVRSFCIVSDVR